MGCVLRTSKLYKDMISIYGEEYSTDAYAMAYYLDDFMNMDILSTDTLSMSNNRQIVFTVPKAFDKFTQEKKKQPHLKGKLLAEIKKRNLDTIKVKEAGKATLVIVKPDRVLTDEAYKNQIPEKPKTLINPLYIGTMFEDDYALSDTMLEEQEEASEKEYTFVQPKSKNNTEILNEAKQEMRKEGVQLSLFEALLNPEQTEVYENFGKYFPKENEYFTEQDKIDFIKLLNLGGIEPSCGI